MTSSIPNTAMSRRTHKGPTESARRTRADNQLKSPTIEEALLAFEYADSQGSDTDSYVSTDTDDDEDDEQCPPFGHNSLGRHGSLSSVSTAQSDLLQTPPPVILELEPESIKLPPLSPELPTPAADRPPTSSGPVRRAKRYFGPVSSVSNMQTEMPKAQLAVVHELVLEPAEASLPPVLSAAPASDSLPSPPAIVRRAKRNFSQATRPPSSAPSTTIQTPALVRADSQISTVAEIAAVEAPRPGPTSAGPAAPTKMLPGWSAPLIPLRPEPVVGPLKSMFELDTPSEDKAFADAQATPKPKTMQCMLTRLGSLRVRNTFNAAVPTAGDGGAADDWVKVATPSVVPDRNKKLPPLPELEFLARLRAIKPSKTTTTPQAVVVRNNKFKPGLRRRATSGALISAPIRRPSVEFLDPARVPASRRGAHYYTPPVVLPVEPEKHEPIPLPEPEPGPLWQRPSSDPMHTKPDFVFAHTAYAATEDGYLSFEREDFIRVTQRDDSGWWEGELGGVVGWFPSNYVTTDGVVGSHEYASARTGRNVPALIAVRPRTSSLAPYI